MDAITFLNSSNDTKQKLISSNQVFQNISTEELVKILVRERNLHIFSSLTSILTNTEEIQDKFNFIHLIRMLSNDRIKNERKFSFISIIIGVLYRRKNLDLREKEKKELITILRGINYPILRAFTVLQDNLNKIFTLDEIRSIYGDSQNLTLFSMKLADRRDLIINTIDFLSNIPSSNPINSETQSILMVEGESIPGYEWLLADSLKGAFSKKEFYKPIKMTLLLGAILSSNYFPLGKSAVDPSLQDLYSTFIEVENLLFNAYSKHRDHAFHSFHVFLIGLHFLTLRHELFRFTDKYHGEEFLCWVMTSFFHDIGYGVQQIDKITEKIDKQLKGFGEVIRPEFKISESLRLFGEQILKYMNNILIETKDKEDHELSIYSSLLESWENRDHGIMSAMIMLKKVNEYIVNEPHFTTDYNSIKWANVFLRAALAMTIHTIPKERRWKINVDKTLASKNVFPYIHEPLFFTFLLTLIDTIEYLNRPRFVTSDDGIGTVPVKDVNLNLNITCYFTVKKYLLIDIEILYSDLDYLELIKIAKNMYNRLQHFCSDTWGVKISLKTDKDWSNQNFIEMKKLNLLPHKPEVNIVLCRTEIEDFLSIFDSKVDEYENFEVELYKAFFKISTLGLDLDPNIILKPLTRNYDILMMKHFIKQMDDEKTFGLLTDFFNLEEIDSFIPANMSMQLLDYLRMKKKKYY